MDITPTVIPATTANTQWLFSRGYKKDSWEIIYSALTYQYWFHLTNPELIAEYKLTWL